MYSFTYVACVVFYVKVLRAVKCFGKFFPSLKFSFKFLNERNFESIFSLKLNLW